ncbi:N-(5'-phosphoribosyl)anthranilate isomerase [bacterium]|nr:N-(5'-phosphoribosyl)anthranilate isomerase [bacterium]
MLSLPLGAHSQPKIRRLQQGPHCAVTIFPQAVKQQPLTKICGLTRAEDARLALELGASFLGIIMTAKSPRHVPLSAARNLVREVRADHPNARFIGVFVNEPPEVLREARETLDLLAVQIHGDHRPAAEALGEEAVIPAVAIRDTKQAEELAALSSRHPAVLADSFSEGVHGGTGKVFNHALVRPVIQRRRLFLAGGLGPDNIGTVVGALGGEDQPYAYDLSSGVEASAGIKSDEKLRRYFAEFQSAVAALSAGSHRSS